MPMSTENALQARNERHQEIMSQLFDLKEQALNVEGSSLSPAAAEALSEGQVRAMRAREGEAWAQDRSAQLKDEFIYVEEQYAQELAKRREEIMEALFGSGEEADGKVMLDYANASSEALISVLEMATASNNLEVVTFVSLAAWARDLEEVQNRITILIPETADLLGELADIDARLEDLDDPGQYFDAISPEVPTRETLLRQ